MHDVVLRAGQMGVQRIEKPNIPAKARGSGRLQRDLHDRLANLREARRQQRHAMAALGHRMAQVQGVPLGPAAGSIGVQDDQGDVQGSSAPSTGIDTFRFGWARFKLRSCRAMDRAFRSIDRRSRMAAFAGRFRRLA